MPLSLDRSPRAAMRYARDAVTAALSASCLFVVGCLSDEERREADEATIAYSAQPPALDPALVYSVEAAALIWNIYLAPLTYRHVDGRASTELVPALATAKPAVSQGGRRYEFRFRPRLRYSDGRRVRASDFEHAIKRTLYLASPGTKYFLNVRGAAAFVKAHDADRDIPGIVTRNKTGRVSIDLARPDGTFPYALASWFAAPVPADTPFKRLTEKLPPATGPFAFDRVDSFREIVLARNREMAKLPHVPRARLERLTVRVMKNRALQAQRVIQGELDYMFDPLPADTLTEVRREHSERYTEFTTNSTLYFWLNSSVPPFSDHALRRAVHLGLDKTALARLYGGLLEPTCNFLPPGMPGYREFEPCPFGAPAAGGDLAAARAIVRREGALGTEVNVWGHTLEPNSNAAEAFADRLREMGFKPRLKLVSASVYFQLAGSERPGLHAGIGAWYQEYPHPASFFEAVRGDLISDEANYNYSRTNNPALTTAIKRTARRRGLDAGTRRRWAELDRRVVEDAGVIPYGHSRTSLFMSERMNFSECAPRHLVYITDFSRFCVR